MPEPTIPTSSAQAPNTLLDNTSRADSALSISIDWDFYAQFLEDVDLSEAQKREFLEAILSIVISCVDLGFNIHPAQLAIKDDDLQAQSCEPIGDKTPDLAPHMLDLIHAHTSDNTAGAAKPSRSVSERTAICASKAHDGSSIIPKSGGLNDG